MPTTDESRSVIIRPVTPDDASGVVAVLNPIIAAGIYSVLDTPVSEAAERQFIRNFPRRGVFHVAVDSADERIVGFQNVEPIASYTHAFDHVGSIATYVDLERKRRGIARMLFAETCAAAQRQGYEKLFTFVRADNPAALATYLSQRFEIIGTAKKQAKVNGRYVDEVLIERWL